MKKKGTLVSDGWFDDDDEDVTFAVELIKTLRTNRRKIKNQNAMKQNNAKRRSAKPRSSYQATPITYFLPPRAKSSGGKTISSTRKSVSFTNRKRVQFVDIPEEILARPSGLNLQHPNKFWYSPEETTTIFESVRSLLQKLEHMQHEDCTFVEIRDCLRGLEGAFPVLRLIEREQNSKAERDQHGEAEQDQKGKAERRLNQSTTSRGKANTFVRTILDWQEDQRYSADVYSLPHGDPIGLRTVSVNCSQKSRELALARADQDSQEVQKFWNNKAEEVTIDQENCRLMNIAIADYKSNVYTIQSVMAKKSHHPTFQSKATLTWESQSKYSSLRDHLCAGLLVDSSRQLSSFF